MDDLEFLAREPALDVCFIDSEGGFSLAHAARADAFDPAVALSALGHPDRFEIMRLLSLAGDAGLGSGELARRLGLARSTASTHLAALREAGLVRYDESRAVGRYGHYRSDVGSLGELATVLTRLAGLHSY